MELIPAFSVSVWKYRLLKYRDPFTPVLYYVHLPEGFVYNLLDRIFKFGDSLIGFQIALSHWSLLAGEEMYEIRVLKIIVVKALIYGLTLVHLFGCVL